MNGPFKLLLLQARGESETYSYLYEMALMIVVVQDSKKISRVARSTYSAELQALVAGSDNAIATSV
eukprot:5980558-Amphidinium_carterae.2